MVHLWCVGRGAGVWMRSAISPHTLLLSFEQTTSDYAIKKTKKTLGLPHIRGLKGLL